MSDSLVIANAIELLGGGVNCTLPQCQSASGVGSIFSLSPGYDQGAPLPIVDTTVENILDGERPFGTRTGNRLMTLPIVIQAPDYPTLASSRETLLQLIDQDEFIITWIRDNYAAGTPSPAVISNGSFESGVSGWTAINGAGLTQSSTYAHGGTYSGRIQPNGSTAYPSITGPVVSISPGQGAGFSIWAQITAAFTCYISIQFRNSSHTVISAATVQSNITLQSSDGFQQISIAGIAPTGAIECFITIGFIGTPPNTNYLYLDDGANSSASAFTDLLAEPMIYNCYRANQSALDYSSRRDRTTYVGTLTLSIPAAPFGRSEQPQTVTFVNPLAGTGSAPVSPVTIEQFQSSFPSLWKGISSAKQGNVAAQYTGYTRNNNWAVYSKTGLSLNLTGQASLGHWLGFSADPTVWGWNYLWGTTKKADIHLFYTLTDSNGLTLTFGKTYQVRASMKLSAPKWQYVSVPLPSSTQFNWANVTGWSITITNWKSAQKLRYTVPSLDVLTANPVSLNPVTNNRGYMYQINGALGTARTPVSIQAAQPQGSGVAQTVTFNSPGNYQWTCPFGVSTVSVLNTGSGGNSGDSEGANACAGGAGGGGTAANASVAVTAGNMYSLYVDFPGAQGTTTFTGDSVTVTANSGKNGGNALTGGSSGTAGAGGAAGTGGHAGGSGAAGVGGSGGHSGGGGSAAGTSAAGNNASGATGGAAVTGGGRGANGGTLPGNYGGLNGGNPGGGASGNSSGTGGTYHYSGTGGNGQVQLTYTPVYPPFQTCLLHIPGTNTPANLMPLVGVGNGGDVPNGGTEYAVSSLDPAANPQFNGTYSVVLVAYSWDTPANSRTLTVTVKQYPNDGGAASPLSVSTTITPNNLPLGNGFVTVGEITLPVLDVAPDNYLAYYTITVTSTDTNDRFLDCFFLDTQGQLVLISSPVTYTTFYVDEPSTLHDIGRVLGTQQDRDSAQSVLGSSLVSGGPLQLQIPDTNLLAYCIEGAPNIVLVYTPSWRTDRTM